MLGPGDKTPDYTEPSPMESLSLPLDYSAIERIIPHRYPFLLVDRIIELEPDKRIVGIKNVSLNERYLSRQPGTKESRYAHLLGETAPVANLPEQSGRPELSGAIDGAHG